MIKDLIKAAKDLDEAGFRKEADIVDLILRKVAQEIVEEDEPSLGGDIVLSNDELNQLLNIERWRSKHPARYSDDLSGFNSWKEDVSNTLGTNDDQTLSSVLSGMIYTDKITNWSDFSTIFPRGEEIRKAWQAKNPKQIETFLSWLGTNNYETTDEILRGLNDVTTSDFVRIAPTKKAPVIDTVQSTDDVIYGAILKGIGAPITSNNMAYLYAWRQAEGGKALYNPFNTTQKASGASNYNSVGVKNYASPEQGVAATVKTMLNERYEHIISCLRNDKAPAETAEALSKSRWGTGELAVEVISGYESGATPKPPEIARA